MGKFLKFAIGVAVLGVVGLVGLGVLSIVAALVVGRSASHQIVASDEVPASASHVAGIERGVYDTFNAPASVPHSVQSSWGQVEQVPVLGFRISVLALGILLLFGMPAILFIVIRSARRGRATIPSDETALVHELARRAQDLAQRMEALETILLDRTRAAR